jgi:hypothetical protein
MIFFSIKLNETILILYDENVHNSIVNILIQIWNFSIYTSKV